LQRIAIAPTQIVNNDILLTPAQHHYLTRVLRLQTGGQFQAIDGTGQLYLCELAASNAQIVELITPLVGTTPEHRKLPPITLICALPKGNNFDDIVRACTELGVTDILPAMSERTLLVPSPQKQQRWGKIAQEATEQSERLTVPTIAEPRPLQRILSELPELSDKYLCEARGEYPHLLTRLQSRQLIDRPIIVAIGPEGGWTPTEIQLGIAYQFQLVSLGRQILRTITAPIVALSIVTAALA
jgi:16S rRNA (uracil1498-N3)-methyltransferase